MYRVGHFPSTAKHGVLAWPCVAWSLHDRAEPSILVTLVIKLHAPLGVPARADVCMLQKASRCSGPTPGSRGRLVLVKVLH